MSFAESTAGATLKPSIRDSYEYIALAILLPQESHKEMRACGKYCGEPSKVGRYVIYLSLEALPSGG